MALYNSSKKMEGEMVDVMLMKSDRRIRKDILKLTPIGSSMEEVVKVVENNEKWEIDWIWDNRGYGIDKNGIPGEPDEDSNLVGAKSISADIGCYYIPLKTYVTVYWGFDENSKLIEIAVRKDIDTL